jgi:hypothetical protein
MWQFVNEIQVAKIMIGGPLRDQCGTEKLLQHHNGYEILKQLSVAYAGGGATGAMPPPRFT